MGLFDNLEFEEDRPRGLFGGRFPDPKPYPPTDFGAAMPTSLADPTFPRYLDSARYWGTILPQSDTDARSPVHGFYLSPAPRLMNWDSARGFASSAQNFQSPAADDRYGEWTGQGGAGPQSDPRILSDVTPDNDWMPGAQYAGDGHHFLPQAFWRKKPFPSETLRVFDKATSGHLHIRGHENDKTHREYSDAVDDLVKRFMLERNIKPETTTPDHARALLKAIESSQEPPIRSYHEFIKRLKLLYRLRTGGRGSE